MATHDEDFCHTGPWKYNDVMRVFSSANANLPIDVSAQTLKYTARCSPVPRILALACIILILSRLESDISINGFMS